MCLMIMEFINWLMTESTEGKMMCLMIMEFINWMISESTEGKNDVSYDNGVH